MVKNLNSAKIHIAVVVASLYLLPLIVTDKSVMVILLLILYPLLYFVVNFVYAYKNGAVWYFPLLISLLFAPCVYIYFNASALVYVVIYCVLAFIGAIFGGIFKKFKSV